MNDTLTAQLRRDIPMAALMDVRVIFAGAEQVELTADFQTNRNLHGSVFAGSQFSLATLAGWSLATVWAEQNSLAADVVMQHGQIDYRKPLIGDPLARATWPAEADPARALKLLRAKGRARLSLHIELCDPDGTICATLAGDYVLSRPTGE